MKNLVVIDWIAFMLVVIGGINWGLVGFFNFNLVDFVFSGGAHFVARIIYALVGLAALYMIYIAKKFKV